MDEEVCASCGGSGAYEYDVEELGVLSSLCPFCGGSGIAKASSRVLPPALSRYAGLSGDALIRAMVADTIKNRGAS